jgi:hypothetical protein
MMHELGKTDAPAGGLHLLANVRSNRIAMRGTNGVRLRQCQVC